MNGTALPLYDRVLMFGGINDGRAVNTLKVVKFYENGTASVTEDDGTIFSNGKNLDVVEAGCAVQKREVFCFGGRQINENGTVMASALDTLRIFKLQNDTFDCASGSVEINGECKFCEIGYYSNEFSHKKCVPCPEGTYGFFSGSKKFACIPVPVGHFSGKNCSKKYENCSDNDYCPMGSASRENKNPLTESLKSSKPELYKIPSEDELKANIVAYSASTVLGVIVAFLFLCLPSKKYLWKLDGYSNKYVDSLDPDTHR
eukprot:MONOS_11583.1-p1 / transcript=MONOS_11583.1 / gene=MONOS_11583 / organism=Monocercomonoides_exilis_PA203 / gene_product=unspecified product / transcript_product=unspecified product / location=Mono_scaffold00589:7-863(-) / protein_length=258 / sequence_SO=supercontig / SO=protein_coding / is_pseudo=false